MVAGKVLRTFVATIGTLVSAILLLLVDVVIGKLRYSLLRMSKSFDILIEHDKRDKSR